jgi:hypothetical protein
MRVLRLIEQVSVHTTDSLPQPGSYDVHIVPGHRLSLELLDVVGSVEVVGEAGIEPTTTGLEGRCSIQLSYSPDTLAIVNGWGTARKLRQRQIPATQQRHDSLECCSPYLLRCHQRRSNGLHVH